MRILKCFYVRLCANQLMPPRFAKLVSHSRFLPVTAILFVSAFLPLLLSSAPVSFAASNGCASNEIMNIAVGGGQPNTLTYFSVHSASAATMGQLLWLRPVALPAVNGTYYTQDSVANSWTVNSNFTQWTFHINPDVYWSNGQQVTAQDWVNTFSPQFDLNPTYDSQNLRSEVVSVVPVNSSTVVFNLNKTDAWLPSELDAAGVQPPAPSQFISAGPSFTGFGVVTVDDGAYYVENYTTGSTQAVLLRNPYFVPLPQICEIIVSFTSSASDITTLMSSGQYDLALPDQVAVNPILSTPNLHADPLIGLWQTSLSWNLALYPYNMTQFRQAIAYAVNQGAILDEAYGGWGVTSYNAEGLIPAAATEFYDPNQITYSYNDTAALNLLHSIGFTGGTNGAALKYPNGTAVTLSLWAATSGAGPELAGQIVQQDLQAIGMTINVNDVATSTLVGDFYANVGGIKSAMIVQDSSGQTPGDAWKDAQTASVQAIVSIGAYSTWLPVGAPTNDYNGNLTALKATNSPGQVKQILDNIQLLNSQYLPILMLSNPNKVWVYSTARFTNWHPLGYTPQLSDITLALLTQVGVTTSTSPSSTLTYSSITSTSSPTATTTSSLTLATSTVSATSSSTSSSISSSTTLIAAIVVVIIVVIAAVLVFGKRRGAPTQATTTQT